MSWPYRTSPPAPRWNRWLTFLALDVLVSLAAWAGPALADTSAALRNPRPVCYCACAESHARGGCAKMCELRKYASRWWATSCAKPRMQSPANNSNTGPRLPHPEHAEHAQRWATLQDPGIQPSRSFRESPDVTFPEKHGATTASPESLESRKSPDCLAPPRSCETPPIRRDPASGVLHPRPA